MKIQFVDTVDYLHFAPLSLTRPIADIRVGIFTNTERVQRLLPNCTLFYDTVNYLSAKYPNNSNCDIQLNSSVILNAEILKQVENLPDNTQLTTEHRWIAKKGNAEQAQTYTGEVHFIEKRWHLYQKNEAVLSSDFAWLTTDKVSQPISSTNTIIGNKQHIFLEEGAKVEASILNPSGGYIYVGKDAEIMEGSIVRGSLAMLDSSALKLGTKVYGATTLGPHCKVGGEVNNVIFQAYSNKGHDGFLGNALIGEWCNLGADTNCSNLKNNYGNITTYDYAPGKEVEVDTQFMGLTMGDHSKCGINTMFNTASVVGVSCNVFGSDFPQKHLPSFSWGGNQPVKFKLEKVIEYANNMMTRRGLALSEAEIEILTYLHGHV